MVRVHVQAPVRDRLEQFVVDARLVRRESGEVLDPVDASRDSVLDGEQRVCVRDDGQSQVVRGVHEAGQLVRLEPARPAGRIREWRSNPRSSP